MSIENELVLAGKFGESLSKPLTPLLDILQIICGGSMLHEICTEKVEYRKLIGIPFVRIVYHRISSTYHKREFLRMVAFRLFGS